MYWFPLHNKIFSYSSFFSPIENFFFFVQYIWNAFFISHLDAEGVSRWMGKAKDVKVIFEECSVLCKAKDLESE